MPTLGPNVYEYYLFCAVWICRGKESGFLFGIIIMVLARTPHLWSWTLRDWTNEGATVRYNETIPGPTEYPKPFPLFQNSGLWATILGALEVQAAAYGLRSTLSVSQKDMDPP